MLGLIILLPIIGSLFFFRIENEDQSVSNTIIARRNSIIKQIGLATSLITLVLVLFLFSQMNNNVGGYQFTETLMPFGFLGIDGISIYYVLLTAFITPIALLSN
jgi:NADH-quinone oxidoreductase subunit M